METNLEFSYEIIHLGLENFPIRNKDDVKDLVFEIYPGTKDSYEIGHKILNIFDEMTKDGNGDNRMASFLYTKDALKEEPICFIVALGGIGLIALNKTPKLSSEKFFEESYDMISEILKAQNSSLSELYNTALEISFILKMSVLSFKIKNEKPGMINSLQKMYEAAASITAITFILSVILECE